MMRPLSRFLKRLGLDQRGVSAVEFAFIAPVMILFYFGMVETCQIMMAERRTVRAASAIADLVAQAPGQITVTGTGGINDIFEIADTLMTPFVTGTDLKVCLLSIVSDNNNVKTVDWRQVKNAAACPADGATVTDVPAGLMSANQSLVMARVTYSYSGAANKVIKVNPSFTRTFYLRPRRSFKIECSTC